MKTFLTTLFMFLSVAAFGQITHDLAFPSVDRTTGSNKKITCSFGEIHGKTHFHTAVDIGVNGAKLRPSYDSFFRENGLHGTRDEYLDFGYYGSLYDPDNLDYIMRYMHCKMNDALDAATKNQVYYANPGRRQVHSWDGQEYVLPKTKAEMDNKYDPHVHFCIINPYDLMGSGNWTYGNPVYNNIISSGSRVDLYKSAVNGNSSQRNFWPIHINSKDKFRPKFRGVDWQGTTVTVGGKNQYVLKNNLATKGPILKVGDRGINEQLANTCTVYRADSYIEKQGTGGWNLQFIVCFDRIKKLEKDDVDKVFARRNNFGNDDWIKMYRTSDPLSVHPAVLSDSGVRWQPVGTYNSLSEGKHNFLFVAMGYEDSETTMMLQSPEIINPNYPGSEDEDEYATDPVELLEQSGSGSAPMEEEPETLAFGSVVIDNDSNPRLASIKVWQDRDRNGIYEYPANVAYEQVNNVVMKNIPLRANLESILQISFSEDAYISSVNMDSGTTTILPSSIGYDTDFGIIYQGNPPVHEPDESKWVVVFPGGGQYTGNFSLNLASTDLAANAVNITTAIVLQYSEENGAMRWEQYR